MTEKEKMKYDEMARIIKAMAHPTRLYIVDQLNIKEQCVCELNAKIDADVSTVSKHLSVLKNTGIIIDERRGNNVFYKLRCHCVLNFYQCVYNVIRENTATQLSIMD